ncbi:hypothetical protein PGB90_005095 [Kerria lacca]
MALANEFRSISTKRNLNNKTQDEILRSIISPQFPQNPLEILGEYSFKEPRTIPKEEIGTPVQEFFRDTNIFVTGVTGFVGIVLLEKLLRTCPHINHIYVFVRSKRKVSSQERFNEIFNNKFFNRLKHEVPNFYEKLSLIDGCLNEPGLNLSNENRQTIINKVNIIYHCAATVRFDENLRNAITINALGTREIIRLAREIKNLKVCMFVSTAYSFCFQPIIEEKVFQVGINYGDIIEKVTSQNNDVLMKEERKILKIWPNTYTFSKALTETMIEKECKDLPFGIFRPSVILSTCKEPVKGWINNVFGPIGFALGFSLGIVHVYYGDLDADIVDFVPVDYVVNALICSSRETYLKYKETPMMSSILVYNYANSGQNTLSWRQLQDVCTKEVREIWPFSNAVWYPFLINTENYFLYRILNYFLHKVPGYIIDFILETSGKQPVLSKVYKKIDDLEEKLRFFSQRKWIFKTDRMNEIWEKLTPEDKEHFFFNLKETNRNQFMKTAALGLRIYQMNDDISTIPSARIKMKWLSYAHRASGPKSQNCVRCPVSPTWRRRCFSEAGGYGVGYPEPPFGITSGPYIIAEKVAGQPISRITDTKSTTVTPFLQISHRAISKSERTLKKLEGFFFEYPILKSLFENLILLLNERDKIYTLNNFEYDTHFKKNLDFLKEISKKINAIAIILDKKRIENLKDILYELGLIEKDKHFKLVSDDKYLMNEVSCRFNQKIRQFGRRETLRNRGIRKWRNTLDWIPLSLVLLGRPPFTEKPYRSPAPKKPDRSPSPKKPDRSPSPKKLDRSPAPEELDESPTSEEPDGSPTSEEPDGSPTSEEPDRSPPPEKSSRPPPPKKLEYKVSFY